MPLSTNAPFDEFGMSMVLRDIEQLYLKFNGAGTGSAGDGGTQDQTVGVTQDVDLSGYATTDYVDAAAQAILDSIPTVTYPISIANGGTGATTKSAAKTNLDLQGVKCLSGANTGDTSFWGRSYPITEGIGTRLWLAGGTEPTTTEGYVLAQIKMLCSDSVFGNDTVINMPNTSKYKFDGPVGFNSATIGSSGTLVWPGGTLGGTDTTYINSDSVYTDTVYAKSVQPENGYSGNVSVRNSAGTGVVTLTFTNGILTYVA